MTIGVIVLSGLGWLAAGPVLPWIRRCLLRRAPDYATSSCVGPSTRFSVPPLTGTALAVLRRCLVQSEETNEWAL